MAVSVRYPDTVHVLDQIAGRAEPYRDGPLSAYSNGYCAVYAAALTEATGWEVVAVGAGECQMNDPEDCNDYGHGICSCCVDHFYALKPEGWLLDVHGEHDPEAVDWGVLVPINDQVLACVLESWHWGDSEASEFAAWARELVAKFAS